ncbi:cullin [Acrasis kona]|uniref:Cullin n=1 Tax=Acrasis kona TaxID=1008807 RepID=A0AAW2Z6X0_9EUKA
MQIETKDIIGAFKVEMREDVSTAILNFRRRYSTITHNGGESDKILLLFCDTMKREVVNICRNQNVTHHIEILINIMLYYDRMTESMPEAGECILSNSLINALNDAYREIVNDWDEDMSSYVCTFISKLLEEHAADLEAVKQNLIDMCSLLSFCPLQTILSCIISIENLILSSLSNHYSSKNYIAALQEVLTILTLHFGVDPLATVDSMVHDVKMSDLLMIEYNHDLDVGNLQNDSKIEQFNVRLMKHFYSLNYTCLRQCVFTDDCLLNSIKSYEEFIKKYKHNGSVIWQLGSGSMHLTSEYYDKNYEFVVNGAQACILLSFNEADSNGYSFVQLSHKTGLSISDIVKQTRNLCRLYSKEHRTSNLLQIDGRILNVNNKFSSPRDRMKFFK